MIKKLERITPEPRTPGRPKGKTKKDHTRIGLYLNPRIAELVRAEAERERRTITAEIEMIIEKYFKARE